MRRSCRIMLAMAKTDQELLDALRDAYHKILLGGTESYAVAGRNWSALNIGDLERAIDRLEHRIQAAKGSRPTLARFGRPKGSAR